MIRLLLALLLLSGCGPMMRVQQHKLQAFSAVQRCGQGPYTFDLPGMGSRWEEGASLRVFSPHDVSFQYEVSIDGNLYRTGTIGKYRMVPDAHDIYHTRNAANGLDNERCVRADFSVDEVPLEVTTDRYEPPATAWTPATIVPDNEPNLHPVKPPPQAIEQWLVDTHRGTLKLPVLNFQNRDPEKQALSSGAALQFVLWSIQPNDLEDVIFVVEHWSRGPKSDEALIAWLEKKRIRQTLRVKRQQARHRKRATHRIRRAARKKNRTPKRAKATAPPTVNQPAPKQPGKPPPPVPEEAGSPPHTSAFWTPGYWFWHQERWIWVSGWWSGADVEIPLALPPNETATEPPPPKPNESALFIPGHWSVSIQGQIWHPGRWHLRVRLHGSSE